MKKQIISRLFAAALAVILLCGLSVPALAADNSINWDDFVIKAGDEEVTSSMAVSEGETVVVTVTPPSSSKATFSYDWACSDDRYLDIFPIKSTGGKQIELTGLEEVKRTKLYLTITDKDTDEDCEIEISVRVEPGAASIDLSHSKLDSVSFSKNISSMDLTKGSYQVEYRIFQAIYNSEKKFTVNYPLNDTEWISYIFYGENMTSIDTGNFSKKVNLSANVDALTKTVRTKVEALAKSAGFKSFKYGKHYLPLYIAASGMPAEATAVINLDNLNKNNKWADLVVDESLYLYYYNKTDNTLTKVNSLELFKKGKKEISFTISHGGYFLFSVNDLSSVAKEDTGSSSGSAAPGKQYAIQIVAQTYYGSEASVKAKASAITAQGLLAVAEKKTAGKNAGRWALEIPAQTHYGTLASMSSRASVVLKQGGTAYVELKK